MASKKIWQKKSKEKSHETLGKKLQSEKDIQQSETMQAKIREQKQKSIKIAEEMNVESVSPVLSPFPANEDGFPSQRQSCTSDQAGFFQVAAQDATSRRFERVSAAFLFPGPILKTLTRNIVHHILAFVAFSTAKWKRALPVSIRLCSAVSCCSLFKTSNELKQQQAWIQQQRNPPPINGQLKQCNENPIRTAEAEANNETSVC